MSMVPPRPIRVFLAEDNRADAYLVEMALREHQLEFSLRLVTDGEEAMKFVRSFGSGEPVPDVALVDINLPRCEGDTVMRTIREQPGCGSLPIIVMTSSARQRDRALCDEFQAVFFSKPSTLPGFLNLGGIVKSLCSGPLQAQ